METIQHRDRAGNYWRFGIDCTPEQGERIRRALASVRNMGQRPALSLSGMLDPAAPLYDDIERAMLRGLAERFPMPQPAQYVPRPRPPQPVQERQAAPPQPSGDPEDDGPAYWWDNL